MKILIQNLYSQFSSRANLSSLASSAPSVTISSSTSLLPAHPPNVARNVPVRPYVPNMNHICSSSNADGSSSDLDDPDEERWPPLLLTEWRQSDNDPSSALPSSGLNQTEPPSSQNLVSISSNILAKIHYLSKT
ncbi:hypothetical protein FRX31_004408 [Thalictrum thalictroides]|uniref:Uncharacterized protein n=1 Tax=Thalictrum thalictroides TaxID=46969 RepID=A0A7J6XAZ6_THATH|nr:hypothetical protein FRX31_004408 [Thalictrum thalictroides]